LFENNGMQGTLKRWKLGSYEVKKFGEAGIAQLVVSCTKFQNFSTSQLPHLQEAPPVSSLYGST